MKDQKRNFAGLTRREFLSLSGAAVAGVALTGVESSQGARKEAEVWGQAADRRALWFGGAGRP